MTNDEKVRAYDEALEKAREELKQDLHESGVWAIKRIFPELAESEDERIRKWLVELVESQEPRIFIEVKKMDVYAWLEKQKEQKPKGVYIDCTEHPDWYGMPPKEQKPVENTCGACCDDERF